MDKTKYCLTALTLILLISCKTYTVSPESFKEQLTRNQPAGMKERTINNPLLPYSNITYQANQVSQIAVVDKKGNHDVLDNSPALETRVTLKNGKRYHFYFDTLYLKNDTLVGGRSRFISTLTRKIPFDSIQKIEIQDGGKKFDYQ